MDVLVLLINEKECRGWGEPFSDFFCYSSAVDIDRVTKLFLL